MPLRRRIALIAVVVVVLGTLVTWGVWTSGSDSSGVARSGEGTSRVDSDADEAADPDAGEAADPDAGEAGDPDAGEGGESAAIRGALEWYYGQRALPGKRVPVGALAAAYAQAVSVPAYRDTGIAPAVQPTWTDLGPRPVDMTDPAAGNGSIKRYGFGIVSGRVTALAVAPGTDQVAYAGGADGGVWKTIDGGTTWTPITEKLSTQAIGAITVDPRSPDTVWVGTGEANTSQDAYYGTGIYRSTDGGTTWRRVGRSTFNQATVFRIVLNGAYALAATSHGLYRSDNSGRTWTRPLAPGGTTDLYGNFVTDVSILPGHGGRFSLAAVGWRGGDSNNGLYYSTDSGVSYTKITPPGFAPQANIGRISLAAGSGGDYAVVQDAVLFNSGSGTDGLNGVYRTTTGPTGTWTRVATGTSLIDSNSQVSCYGEHPGVQAWYDQYVTVDPTDSDHVVLGLEEIFDSTDGGTTWHTIGRYSNQCNGSTLPTTHPDQHAGVFAVSGAGNPTLYVGNDGGVWKQAGPALSNDNWVDLNATLSLTQPYFVAASAGRAPTIVIGTQDNGTIRGTTTDPTWEMVLGGDGAGVAIAPTAPSTMYAEYTYLTMSKSTDSGDHWTSIYPPDANSGANARFIAPFMLDPTDAAHLVALGRHVWETHTAPSVSWSQVYDNGTGHLGTALDVRGATVYEGWCGPCNPTTLSSDAPFARGFATNAGGSWHATAANGLPNRYVSGVLVDPHDAMHVYVAMSGFSRKWIPGGGSGHVFESTDGGENFTDISANLPDAPANDLVLSSGQLVAATDTGVYKRNSSGTWGRFGTGMPRLSVLDLTVVPRTGTILAATHGRGVWSLPA